jgi:hypothetical protein
MAFRPGAEHKLDVQEREARNYRALLTEQLNKLQKIQAELNTMDDPGVLVSREEAALKSFLWEMYRDHKHRDHIAATFLAIRRARLLARFEAAAAALEMAADLLRPDDMLLKELRAAVSHQQQEAERRKLQLVTQPPSQGNKEDQEQKGPPQIDSRHIYGDQARARARLAEFDAQAAQMRSAISPAIGWFEEFYVKKTRYTAQAREYLKRDKPIPDDVQALEDVWYGPYLKYRWQEITSGPQYTIQMGLIPADERAAAEQWAAILGEERDEDRAPWPLL